uniref:Mitochondrial carrier protein n=1 Tax=Angiostrongylus cantonensis TaxID=6313 RepID=A0A0K0DA93_ANGCA
MSIVVESPSHKKDAILPEQFPLPPREDEHRTIGRCNNGGMLNVIEWHHMNLSLFYPAALGSTWTVRTCLYPLTVLRSRLQLQKQHTVYRNTWSAFTSIFKQEGIPGLFRGFWVTIPQVGTSFIYATVYEKLRAVLLNDYGVGSAAGISSISGGAASFSTQIIFVPTDIIAQYMMIYYRADKFISGHDKAIINYVMDEKNSRLTLGMRFLKAIYKVDGLKGFYRILGIVLRLRSLLSCFLACILLDSGFLRMGSIFFSMCLILRGLNAFKMRPQRTEDSSLLLLDQTVAAFMGGICSTISTNPMEMFRIRVQVHRSTYKETLSRMLRDEKRHIFTKGLTPRLLSNSIYTCVVMVGYEIVKRLCVLPEYKNRERLLVIQWEHLDLWRFYPLALASSWSIRCVLYPMSVVKSRLQLQRQNSVYRGMRHAFTEILKVEGVGAFYRGFWMTLPQLSASFLYSSTYERVRDLLQVHIGIRNPSLVSALAGAIASPCAQLVFVPTDIVAQHMMVHNNPEAFGGSRRNIAVANTVRNDGLKDRRTLGLRVVRAVYKVDGLSGFYRGFFSAVMLYIPSTMVFWSTYYHALGIFRRIRAKVTIYLYSNGTVLFLFTISMYIGVRSPFCALSQHLLPGWSKYPRIYFKVTEIQKGVRPKTAADVDNRNFFIDQAISGSIAGIASACATNPLEMLRIRLQVHRTNYTETIRRLWKYEKSQIFTKGLAPRVVSNALYSSLVMVAYETVKKLCVLPEYQEHVVW